MIIDTAFGSAFGLIVRVIGWILLEVFFDILLRGLGFILCRPFKPVSYRDKVCILVGSIAWAVVVIGLVMFGIQWE